VPPLRTEVGSGVFYAQLSGAFQSITSLPRTPPGICALGVDVSRPSPTGINGSAFIFSTLPYALHAAKVLAQSGRTRNVSPTWIGYGAGSIIAIVPLTKLVASTW